MRWALALAFALGLLVGWAWADMVAGWRGGRNGDVRGYKGNGLTGASKAL